mgnify:CR=1 FL=1
MTAWVTKSYRRTLVGLKPPEVVAERVNASRYRRTLVGLKQTLRRIWEPIVEVTDGPSWG